MSNVQKNIEELNSEWRSYLEECLETQKLPLLFEDEEVINYVSNSYIKDIWYHKSGTMKVFLEGKVIPISRYKMLSLTFEETFFWEITIDDDVKSWDSESLRIECNHVFYNILNNFSWEKWSNYLK